MHCGTNERMHSGANERMHCGANERMHSSLLNWSGSGWREVKAAEGCLFVYKGGYGSLTGGEDLAVCKRSTNLPPGLYFVHLADLGMHYRVLEYAAHCVCCVLFILFVFLFVCLFVCLCA